MPWALEKEWGLETNLRKVVQIVGSKKNYKQLKHANGKMRSGGKQTLNDSKKKSVRVKWSLPNRQ